MLCIFFSKQKTAYEWRISDWSSDVCSSDLGQLHRDQGLAAGDEVATHAKARGVAADAACVEAGGARQLLEAPRDRLGMQAAADPASWEGPRVGDERVSTCRARWSPDH